MAAVVYAYLLLLKCASSQLSPSVQTTSSHCLLCSPAGVQFIWDCCCESVKKANSTPGSGCILAHCMGLGKTLQVNSCWFHQYCCWLEFIVIHKTF